MLPPMRQRRLKAPASFPVAHYHCMSRVVNGDFIFQDAERECFVRYMREYERFCGVRVLTFAILSNHFHLMVEVPARPATPLTADEYIARLEGLSSSSLTAQTCRQRIKQFRAAGDAAGEQAYLEKLSLQLWDISVFMQRLKQCFTQWYNSTHGRRGTLWEERFKSVLVQGEGDPLTTISAYIEMNPVRAGLAEDPKDYRWGGYGAAMGGDALAQEGVRALVAMGRRVKAETLSVAEALAAYRVIVFTHGEEREGTTETGEPLRKGFKREDVLAVVAARGRVDLGEYLKLRVRYFTDGAVLGTRAFVDEVFQAFRSRFGATRQDGARRMEGLKPELYVLRDLRKKVFE